jgi:membrane protein DedA with SNARE-associated domain
LLPAFFAHNGGFNIYLLLACAWAAAILGDQCNFMIGHFFGRKIVASGKVKAMTPERVKKTEDFLDKWGHLAIFLGRFFPFIRTFVPFLAGMGGMHWRNFVIFNILGGVLLVHALHASGLLLRRHPRRAGALRACHCRHHPRLCHPGCRGEP